MSESLAHILRAQRALNQIIGAGCESDEKEADLLYRIEESLEYLEDKVPALEAELATLRAWQPWPPKNIPENPADRQYWVQYKRLHTGEIRESKFYLLEREGEVLFENYMFTQEGPAEEIGIEPIAYCGPFKAPKVKE